MLMCCSRKALKLFRYWSYWDGSCSPSTYAVECMMISPRWTVKSHGRVLFIMSCPRSSRCSAIPQSVSIIPPMCVSVNAANRISSSMVVKPKVSSTHVPLPASLARTRQRYRVPYSSTPPVVAETVPDPAGSVPPSTSSQLPSSSTSISHSTESPCWSRTSARSVGFRPTFAAPSSGSSFEMIGISNSVVKLNSS